MYNKYRDMNQCEAMNADGKKRCGRHGWVMFRVRVGGKINNFCGMHTDILESGKRVDAAVDGREIAA